MNDTSNTLIGCVCTGLKRALLFSFIIVCISCIGDDDSSISSSSKVLPSDSDVQSEYQGTVVEVGNTANITTCVMTFEQSGASVSGTIDLVDFNDTLTLVDGVMANETVTSAVSSYYKGKTGQLSFKVNGLSLEGVIEGSDGKTYSIVGQCSSDMPLQPVFDEETTYLESGITDADGSVTFYYVTADEITIEVVCHDLGAYSSSLPDIDVQLLYDKTSEKGLIFTSNESGNYFPASRSFTIAANDTFQTIRIGMHQNAFADAFSFQLVTAHAPVLGEKADTIKAGRLHAYAMDNPSIKQILILDPQYSLTENTDLDIYSSGIDNLAYAEMVIDGDEAETDAVDTNNAASADAATDLPAIAFNVLGENEDMPSEFDGAIKGANGLTNTAHAIREGAESFFTVTVDIGEEEQLENGTFQIQPQIKGGAPSDSLMCGYWIDWGDGSIKEVIDIYPGEETTFQSFPPHVYSAGIYTLSAGGRYNTDLGCTDQVLEYRDLLPVGPDYTAGMADLDAVDALINNHEWEAALKILENEILPEVADDPLAGVAYYKAAKCSMLTGEYEKAVTYFDHVLDSDLSREISLLPWMSEGKHVADSQYFIGVCYEHINALNYAKTAYRQNINDFPESIYVENSLNGLSRISGDHPDLVLSAIEMLDEGSAGEDGSGDYSLSLTVLNNGTSKLRVPVQAHIYGVERTYDTAENGSFHAIDTLDAGEETTLLVNASVESDANYIIVHLDSEELVEELDETNNLGFAFLDGSDPILYDDVAPSDIEYMEAWNPETEEMTFTVVSAEDNIEVTRLVIALDDGSTHVLVDSDEFPAAVTYKPADYKDSAQLIVTASDFAGNANALSIQPNRAPYEPDTPSPSNKANNVLIDSILKWNGGDPDGDAVTYTIEGSIQIDRHLTDFSYTSDQPELEALTPLEMNATYTWQVTTTEKENETFTTKGPMWTFTTSEFESEICDDLIDNDGDGKIDCADKDCSTEFHCRCTDIDSDGYYAESDCGTAQDCDDLNESVYPGATETCGDDIDQNCDGSDLACVQVCTDADSDGYFRESDCGTTVDCNDFDGSIYPGATETCGDGIDQDCDGSDLICEQTCTDSDSDGYFRESNCGTTVDCNDFDGSIYPGATETCGDGIDQDCDGSDSAC